MNATARLAFTRSAMLLMEAMWAYALVAFLAALIVEGDRPSPLGVVAVVFISFSISRLLLNSDLSIGVVRVWGIVMSLLVFYVIVRVDFFGDLRLWDFSGESGGKDGDDGHTAAMAGLAAGRVPRRSADQLRVRRR
jgi:hypothetical protein